MGWTTHRCGLHALGRMPGSFVSEQCVVTRLVAGHVGRMVKVDVGLNENMFVTGDDGGKVRVWDDWTRGNCVASVKLDKE